MSGPTLRATGVDYDVRKYFPYSSYDEFDFRRADAHRRRLLRPLLAARGGNAREPENREPGHGEDSLRRPDRTDAPGIVPPAREKMKTEMESLIYHFKIFTEGFSPPPGEVYQRIESPRGELGFFVASDGSPKPYRVKVRAPSFVNLQALPKLCEGRLVADVIACIGTIDIVLGEVDR